MTVETDGPTVEAERVIVAISPTLSARIEFEPQLPAQRDQLTQRMPQGAIIKCMAVYDEPFWRAEGLSGSGLSDGGSINAIFDNTPPERLARRAARLPRRPGGAPLGQRDARTSAAPSSSRVLHPAVRAARRQPDEYVERNWAAERWSRGCYGGAFGPSGWTDFGPALREPVGRVHWAGTETATVWNGYIDGAITAGRRAASRGGSRPR